MLNPIVFFQIFEKKITFFFFLSLLSFFNLHSFTAITGSGEGSDGFVGIISENGDLTPIDTGAIPPSSIRAVAINNSGVGLIGGEQDKSSSPYSTFAAFISPDGISTPFDPLFPSDTFFTNPQVSSVAISNSGYAIVGGKTTFPKPAVSIITQEEQVIPVTIPSATGNISSVAINDSGLGLVGIADNSPFAGFVSPEGDFLLITSGLPLVGEVSSVAINEDGIGIIGGQALDNTALAAFATQDGAVGTANPIDIGTINNGLIFSVDINDDSRAIIGGGGQIIGPFAAFVSPEGIVTPIDTTAPSTFGILSAKINSSGAAIISGLDPDNAIGSELFAAFVSPEGVVTPFDFASLGNGAIWQVDINDEGIGIIGGGAEGLNNRFVALASPEGVLTFIDLPLQLSILTSVAINDEAFVLSQAVPTSIGPGNSYVNGLFALSSQILPNHFTFHPSASNSVNNREIASLEKNPSSLLADNSQYGKNTSCLPKCCYTLWGAPFGAFIDQDKEQNFPEFDSWIAGGMIGLDYTAMRNLILGIGAAYAYNNVDFEPSLGRARSHQEFLALYGYWCNNNILINAALWGGLYQMKNERKTLGFITSKADIDGYLLNPHLEVSAPCFVRKYCFNINPFVMFDWANNWQDSFEETGDSGLNLNVESQYTSMLRSELGLRFYKAWVYECGCLTLETKGSYVNKTPFNTADATTFFIGSVSTFGIETFSSEMQNLGVFQFYAEYSPKNTRYPYISFNYQGEFGSSFVSNLVSIEIGKKF